MPKSYWLVKSEPTVYAWSRFVEEKRAVWDGVRNFEARNNLRAMKKGDLVFFYHSSEGKEVVGIASVTAEATAEDTDEGEWSVVTLTPKKALKRAVTLAEIKDDPALAEFALVRKSRISVIPVRETEFNHVLSLSGTKL